MSAELLLLKQRLAAAQKPAAGQRGATFVSTTELNDLLTETFLPTVLAHPAFCIPLLRQQDISRTVLKKFRKIFAILVQLGHEGSLLGIIERRIFDERLPVAKEELQNLLPDFHEPFYCLQWSYCAHFFSEDDFEQKLGPANVLPFLNVEEVGSGGFGVVDRVKVHSDYHDYVTSNETRHIELARKRIDSSLVTKNKILQETDTLYTLKSIRHRNIVHILGAYYQNNALNILFPLADFDLDRLLTSAKPKWFCKTVDVLKAMCGLADGLEHIHNFQMKVANNSEINLYGIHHDLKPQNVLIMDQQLVISDFGLCQMKPFNQNSKTKWRESTVDYGPPEARDPGTWEAKEIGRAFDIWSLGALLMELIIYDQKGDEGVREFRQDRTFYDTYGETRCFHKDGKLHISVVDWLKSLKDGTTDNSVVRILELIESMLEINPDSRPGSKNILEILRRIIICHIGQSILSVLEEALRAFVLTAMSSIALAKLAMEKKRLEAWITAVTGFPKEQNYHFAYHQQLGDYASAIHSLEECRDSLILWPEDGMSLKRFSKIFIKLSLTNDELYESQQDQVKASIDDTFAILSVTAQGTYSQLAIQELAIHPNTFSKYSETPLIALSRYMAQMLAGHIPVDLGLADKPLSDTLLDKDQINSNPPTYWYHLGSGEEPRVKALVEWRNYGRKWAKDDDEDSRRIGKILLQRVAILVQMLQRSKQKDFRVLECLGFVHRPERGSFGLVFRVPCQDASAVTLHALFEHQRDKRQQPSLTQKFLLAKALARSLHRLHLSDWMHKCFCSNNVVFFTTVEEPLTLTTVGDPYIRGFEYSRPSGFHEYSEKPDYNTEERQYQHPEYFDNPGRPYQNAYDYYSLGLVLLEIALWRPLNRIYKKFSNAVEARLFYVGYCKEYVAQSMGELYHNAIMSCLGDIFLQSSKVNVARERDHHLVFQGEVLTMLELCRV